MLPRNNANVVDKNRITEPGTSESIAYSHDGSLIVELGRPTS